MFFHCKSDMFRQKYLYRRLEVKRQMKKAIKYITALMTAVSVTVFSLCGVVSYLTPSEITVNPESGLKLNFNFPVSIRYDSLETVQADAAEKNKNISNAEIMLFDYIPVKDVNVSFSERKYIIPCGTPFGIKIYTDGLVVVKTSEVTTNGKTENPSKDAGIQCGDIITSVNGANLTNNEELLNCVENSNGKDINIEGVRNGEKYHTKITPVFDSNQNEYRIGLWVKDSCAGIGTLTFIDPLNNTFAGLGHGICDSESGQIMPLLNGEIVNANISSVRKSCCGSPGSLSGYFTQNQPIGNIVSNSEYGIYGDILSYNTESKSIPLAFRQEVTRGKAQILTTIDGESPKYYDIEIENINYNNNNSTKNMVIKVIDEELLEKTGGIVQGMSGSPIIQNNMFVGAVTHVFVNNPVYGYAIFAENMISFNNSIVQNNLEIAS